MSNLRYEAGWPEDHHAAHQYDKELSEKELDSVVGGNIDYSTWKEPRLRAEVSRLGKVTDQYMRTKFWGMARETSHKLYDAETELINRHIYGDYSPNATFWML